MTTAEGIQKDLVAIAAACKKITDVADHLDVHDAAVVATLKSKAEAYADNLVRIAGDHKAFAEKMAKREAAAKESKGG